MDSFIERLGDDVHFFKTVIMQTDPLPTMSLRLGWLLGFVNAVAFAAILASKNPDYAQLRATDDKFAKTGELDLNSAAPMYLAARPFYSSAHYPDVTIIEDLYFAVNAPATFAALSLSYPIANTTSRWWTASTRVSSAWESWTLASSFAIFGTAWAFALGLLLEWRRVTKGKKMSQAN